MRARYFCLFVLSVSLSQELNLTAIASNTLGDLGGGGGGGEELVLEVLPVESRQSIEKIAILTLPYLYFYNHILTFCFDC